MESTNLASSPKDRGRHRSLAVRPSTARATSGTPHSPCSDTFTVTHPTSIRLPASPPSTGRPPSSPSQIAAEPTTHFQYALSSNFNAASEQSWPRTDPDGGRDGGGDHEEDDPDSSFTPRQAVYRASTKTTAGSSSSRFFRSIVYKFGRTFNRNYFLPHDKQEQERNNLQHEISVEVHDGELYLSPVVNPRRVLDVGTGTGIWAVEFARRNQNSDVIGIDLNPVPQPSFVVPNCRFHIADVDEEWRFSHPFDFIHVRSLGEPADKRRLFKSIYDNLAPGGIKKLGRSLFYILEYKTLLEQAGFQNIVELKFAVPTNTWPPGRQSQKIGALQRTNTLQVIDVFSFEVFTQGLGWTQEALDKLLTEVRKDIENTRIHSYSTLVLSKTSVIIRSVIRYIFDIN
ncbi:S-adenosyl-L-methionine-dependent methyltransferase [Hypoxylon fuscum]|nr:S-adenosyl-L-methionine-dependent methyltransferase [Hypoxylon fuscum]